MTGTGIERLTDRDVQVACAQLAKSEATLVKLREEVEEVRATHNRSVVERDTMYVETQLKVNTATVRSLSIFFPALVLVCAHTSAAPSGDILIDIDGPQEHAVAISQRVYLDQDQMISCRYCMRLG